MKKNKHDLSDEALAEMIRECRAEGLNRDEIADELDLSFNDVKRLIKKYEIKKPPKNGTLVEAADSIPLPINDGVPLMEQAEYILADRLTSDWRGYRLDGQPSNTRAIIEAAGLKFYDEN